MRVYIKRSDLIGCYGVMTPKNARFTFNKRSFFNVKLSLPGNRCYTNDYVVIPSQQRWRGYSNAAVRGWLGEWVSEWVGSWVRAWVRPTLPCGHDSDYSFCPITFKLHMHIYHDERRNPIDFGSRGQRSRSTLALCV